MENTTEQTLTELESAPKHICIWYNKDGKRMTTEHLSPKQAKKALQESARLGWTYRIYRFQTSRTTKIPTVAV